MKTKIIYISGAEVFDMADVRAAFEEVRTALNLSPDTVLFGVPVDADSALAAPSPVDTHAVVDAPVLDVPDVVDIAPVAEEVVVAQTMVADSAAEIVDVPVIPEPVVDVVAPAPKKRGRAKKPVTPEPVASAVTAAAAPIPILSVLAAQDKEVEADTDTPRVTTEQVDVVVPDDPVTEADDSDAVEYAGDEMAAMDVQPDVQSVSIDDVIAEDAVQDMADGEQTLEELLDSITPLQEEVRAESLPDAAADDAIDDAAIMDDTDATLEQLAAEFAQNEDKITATPQSSGRGKIGKLKSFLPFKPKDKRGDPGLMGDLFGWAGIAANDDDFALPGFLH